MNILFISPSVNPYNEKGYGSVQRTNLLLKACSKVGKVDVITFTNNAISNIEGVSTIYSKELITKGIKYTRLQSICALIFPWYVYFSFPKNKEASKVVEQAICAKEYDFIVIRYIPEAMKCGLLKFAEKLIIDVDDNPLDIAKFTAKTAIRLRKRVYHRLQIFGLNITLCKLIKKIRFAFYANPKQAIYKNSAYLPNIPFYEINDASVVKFAETKKSIFFIGNLCYGPNFSGIDHFITNIFPKIRKVVPEVTFNVGGACHETDKLKWNAIPNVNVLGFVDDLLEEYRKSRVIVVPIYTGAGTNIKVLEGMQMMRPIVTTECGIRGFDDFLVEGKDFLLAHNDEEFVEYVVTLLQDEQLNQQISENAITILNNEFTQKKFYSIVSNVIR